MAEEYQLFPIYKEEFHHVYSEHQQHSEFRPLMMHMKVVDANGESSMDEEQWEAASAFVGFEYDLLRKFSPVIQQIYI
jgi:mRNA (guanine-N7-)-methyltransferase